VGSRKTTDALTASCQDPTYLSCPLFRPCRNPDAVRLLCRPDRRLHWQPSRDSERARSVNDTKTLTGFNVDYRSVRRSLWPVMGHRYSCVTDAEDGQCREERWQARGWMRTILFDASPSHLFHSLSQRNTLDAMPYGQWRVADDSQPGDSPSSSLQCRVSQLIRFLSSETNRGR